MKLTTVLFDLDGTLLPMDQEKFMHAYLGALSAKMAPYGYEPKALIKALWHGTGAMYQNNGKMTNEQVFWKVFAADLGPEILNYQDLLLDFYANEFQQVRHACGFDPTAAPCIARLKQMGLHVALATNPLFPSIATESRIRWAGLDPADFELYTTYETSRSCKPNPTYFQEILDRLGLEPGQCLMVGNDAGEDTAAEKLGIPVYLLPACLINKENRDLSAYPQGTMTDLVAYVETLIFPCR